MKPETTRKNSKRRLVRGLITAGLSAPRSGLVKTSHPTIAITLGVFWCMKALAIQIQPERITLLSGAGVNFTALNSTGTVTWAFVQNPSGGTLDAETGSYTAGPNHSVIDKVEVSDAASSATGMVNVISISDLALQGKAIIIAGNKGPTDSLQAVTKTLADQCYRSLLTLGFRKDDIRYFSDNDNRDVDLNGISDDIDPIAHLQQVEFAFTNWAVRSDRLLVYLVGHGGSSSNQYYFRPNADEILSPTNLNTWLNALQNTYGTEVTTILDFVESAGFGQALVYTGAPRRVTISSCASNEPTCFLAGGLISFSDGFFNSVLMGQSVGNAFASAKELMQIYQTPELDDTGDGIYSTNDGPFAATYFIKPTATDPAKPIILTAQQDQYVYSGASASLWADDISTFYGLQRVWCQITPPWYNPITGAGSNDIGSSGNLVG